MVITDRNMQTIRKQEINEEQERFVNNHYRYVRQISKELDYDSLELFGDNVLVKCQMTNSVIVTPGQTDPSSFDWVKLDKVSDKVRETHPDITKSIGKRVFVNLPLLQKLGQGVKYIIPDKINPSIEYHYYKCQAGQVEYSYKNKGE